MSEQRREAPTPFLGRLFPARTNPRIGSGFRYSDAEIDVHGVPGHNAIDVVVRRGTPILAPVDGWAVATYGEYLQTNPDGSPRTCDVATAHASTLDIVPPSTPGPWPVWFGGYVVQILADNGCYVQIAHIDYAAPQVPYFPPTKSGDTDLAHSDVLRKSPAAYKRQATRIEAGTIIGYVGMTGCGWGEPNYSYVTFTNDGRPDFRGVEHPRYDTPHAHLAVFGPRDPVTGDATVFYDPFGLYGQAAQYPKHLSKWHHLQEGAQHHSLWLPQQ